MRPADDENIQEFGTDELIVDDFFIAMQAEQEARKE